MKNKPIINAFIFPEEPLFMITGSADIILLDELHQSRQAGQNAVMIFVGVADMQSQADYDGIPVVHLLHKQALAERGRG